MSLNSENFVTLDTANKNFLSVIEKVDKCNKVVILKDNKPQYVISKFKEKEVKTSENEQLEVIAKKLIKKHKKAFEVLGQW